MGMIGFSSSGSFKNTEGFLNRILHSSVFTELERYGQMGVDALAKATPVDSGLTENSWYYKVVKKHGQYTIEWHNSDVDDEGTPIAILIQYGHGTGTGGWVEGRDFINPALRPLFDEIANNVWKEVTKNG